MSFKSKKTTPPTNEEIETYCEGCEDATSVICGNWLSSMLCDMSNEEIKDCLFALLHYTQGDYNYIPGTPAAKILSKTMRVVIRSNQDKRNRMIEGAKKGAAIRWQKEGNQRREIGKERKEKAQNEKEGNQRGENGKERKGNKISSQKPNTNLLNINALQCPPNADQCVNVNVNENENKKTPTNSPAFRGGFDSGFWGVGFYGVLKIFNSWKAFGDRGANEGRWFAWHSIDPQAAALCEGIRENGDPGGKGRALLNGDTEHRARVEAVCTWKAWRECWGMCESLAGFDPDTLAAFAKECEKNAPNDPGIFDTLADKARYISNGAKVGNLAAFLAARKQ